MAGKKNNDREDEISAKLVKKKRVKRISSTVKKPITLGEVAVEKHSAHRERPSLLLYTFYFVYKNLYVLGIIILRRRLLYHRRLKLLYSKAKGNVYAFLHNMGVGLGRVYRGLMKRIRAPFLRIGDVYRQQRPAIRARQTEGKNAFREYLPVVEMVARLIIKIVATIFNYTAPIVAAGYLLITINRQITQPVGLQLEYGGQKMGYIQNETTFDAATQIIKDRIIDDSTEQFIVEIPSLTLEPVNTDQLLSASDLADRIIRVSGGEIEEAYGLYIDNDFMGAVTDKDVILNELDSIKKRNSSGKPSERIEFVKSIRLKPALYFLSSVVDPESIISRLHSNENEQEIYVVKNEDTPSGIASSQHIPYAQLLEMNPTIEEDLMPGMELRIRVARPYLSVKSIFTDEYEEAIPFETEETQNALYARGYSDVTQEGEDGVRKIVAEITMVNGLETERNILSTEEVVKPVTKKVIVGVNNPQSIVSTPTSPTSPSTPTNMAPSGASSTGFIWPTVGGRATTYRNHPGNGVDIAPGGAGHPIYASAAGTVSTVKSGYTGYGQYIIIDHGNGYQTLYGHNSALYVSVGDQVAQGQVIAAMGRTGNATGNHLHFEVRYNGRYMNPTDYVGYSR